MSYLVRGSVTFVPFNSAIPYSISKCTTILTFYHRIILHWNPIWLFVTGHQSIYLLEYDAF